MVDVRIWQMNSLAVGDLVGDGEQQSRFRLVSVIKPLEAAMLQGGSDRRWRETCVYHWRAAEKAHGHYLCRWLQLGGRLVLRRWRGRRRL